MNQNRVFLLFAWVAVAVLLAFEWLRFTAEPVVVEPPAIETPAQAGSGAIPALPASPAMSAAPPTPPATGLQAGDAPTVTDAPTLAAAPEATPAVAAVQPPQAARQLEVQTDLLRLRISSIGGSLVFAELLDYPLDQENPEQGNVVLLNDDPAQLEIAQAGWISHAAAPGLDSVFAIGVEGERLVMAEGQSELEVPLLWQDAASGLTVRKTYTFRRGSYAIGLRHELVNQGETAFVGHFYQQLQRVPPPPPPSMAMFTNPEVFSFVGASWYSPQEHFEQRRFDDFVADGPLNRTVTDGWIALLQHHFVSAWVPTPGKTQQFSLAALDGGRFAIRSVAAATSVPPGSQQTVAVELWVGPKLQAPLRELHPSLHLTLDYGLLSFLAQPLFWVLAWLYGLFGNWGWAIIGIVVILKILLLPLSAKQYKSMARMRAVAPRIEQLKERYGEDRTKFNQAMMELYQKEKINPLGGCLPMLLPIPIFIALYWVLLESVELRQAPWALWIDNLTAPDPLFILPVLNLVVMWLTQRLTPSPGMDPMQRKMLQWMPVVFGILFAFFPAGLVLYWFTNGLLGLAQQWWMTKRYANLDSQPAVVKGK